MVMIIWQSGSTYLQLIPHLIKGKGKPCLFAITPGSQPRVGQRSLKAVQEGRQEWIPVGFLGFKPQLDLSLKLTPTSRVPIVLRLLGSLTESQRDRVRKRFQPNPL